MERESIIIQTENCELRIKHLYVVQDYYTFGVKMRSGDFAGSSSFCLSRDTILSVINNLTKMYNELNGVCEIHDGDSESFITLKMMEYGHILIYGQMGASIDDHFMKFQNSTDQTVLMKLVKLLSSFLAI